MSERKSSPSTLRAHPFPQFRITPGHPHLSPHGYSPTSSAAFIDRQRLTSPLASHNSTLSSPASHQRDFPFPSKALVSSNLGYTSVSHRSSPALAKVDSDGYFMSPVAKRSSAWGFGVSTTSTPPASPSRGAGGHAAKLSAAGARRGAKKALTEKSAGLSGMTLDGISVVSPSHGGALIHMGGQDEALWLAAQEADEEANANRTQIKVEGFFENEEIGGLIPSEMPRSQVLYVLTSSDGRDMLFKVIQYTLLLVICLLKRPSLFSPSALEFLDMWALRFWNNYNTIRHARSLFKMGRWILNLFQAQSAIERLSAVHAEKIFVAKRRLFHFFVLPVLRYIPMTRRQRHFLEHYAARLKRENTGKGREVHLAAFGQVQTPLSMCESASESEEFPTKSDLDGNGLGVTRLLEDLDSSSAILAAEAKEEMMQLIEKQQQHLGLSIKRFPQEFQDLDPSMSYRLGSSVRLYPSGSVNPPKRYNAQAAADIDELLKGDVFEYVAPVESCLGSFQALASTPPTEPTVANLLESQSEALHDLFGEPSKAGSNASMTNADATNFFQKAQAFRQKPTVIGQTPPPPPLPFPVQATDPKAFPPEFNEDENFPDSTSEHQTPSSASEPPQSPCLSTTEIICGSAVHRENSSTNPGVGTLNCLNSSNIHSPFPANNQNEAPVITPAAGAGLEPAGEDTSQELHMLTYSPLPISATNTRRNSNASLTGPLISPPLKPLEKTLPPGYQRPTQDEHPSESNEALESGPSEDALLPVLVGNTHEKQNSGDDSNSLSSLCSREKTFSRTALHNSGELNTDDDDDDDELFKPTKISDLLAKKSAPAPESPPLEHREESTNLLSARAGPQAQEENASAPSDVIEHAYPASPPQLIEKVGANLPLTKPTNDAVHASTTAQPFRPLSRSSSNVCSEDIEELERPPQPAMSAYANQCRVPQLQFRTSFMLLFIVRCIAATGRRMLRDICLVSSERFIVLKWVEKHRRLIHKAVNILWFIAVSIDLFLSTSRLCQKGWLKYAGARQNVACRCSCKRFEDPADFICNRQGILLRRKTDLIFPPLDMDYGAPPTSNVVFFEAADPSMLRPSCARCGCIYDVPMKNMYTTENPARVALETSTVGRPSSGSPSPLGPGQKPDLAVTSRTLPSTRPLTGQGSQREPSSDGLRTPVTMTPVTKNFQGFLRVKEEILAAKKKQNGLVQLLPFQQEGAVEGKGEEGKKDEALQRDMIDDPEDALEATASLTLEKTKNLDEDKGLLLVPWVMRRIFNYAWLILVHENFTSTLLLQLSYMAEWYLAFQYTFGAFECYKRDAPLSRVIHPDGAIAGLISAVVALIRVVKSAPK